MRKNLFSKANKNIKSAQARYKRDFDKRHQYKKVYFVYMHNIVFKKYNYIYTVQKSKTVL